MLQYRFIKEEKKISALPVHRIMGPAHEGTVPFLANP